MFEIIVICVLVFCGMYLLCDELVCPLIVTSVLYFTLTFGGCSTSLSMSLGFESKPTNEQTEAREQ